MGDSSNNNKNDNSNNNSAQDDKKKQFLKAVRKNDLLRVQELLDQEEGEEDRVNLINAKGNHHGRTPLYIAIRWFHPKVVALLLKNGANVNLGDDKNDHTPLHYACRIGHLEIVKLLVANGADLHAKDKNQGQTPFFEALLLASTLEVAIFLVEHCGGGGADAVDVLVNATDLYGRTPPLHIACCEHFDTDESFDSYCWEKVKFLILQCRADVRAKSHGGKTPLHGACWRFCPEVVELLLKNGAVDDVNTKDNGGKTPLMHVVWNHNYFQKEDAHEPKKEVAKLLLENRADRNARDNSGMTSLHWACENGHLDVAELLVNDKFVNAKDNHGETPLHKACQYRDYSLEIQVGLVRLLAVEHGADVNVQDEDGVTPLHCACENGGNLEMVQLLLSRGANVSVTTTTKGSTPLDIAAERNYVEVVWCLLRQNPWLLVVGPVS